MRQKVIVLLSYETSLYFNVHLYTVPGLRLSAGSVGLRFVCVTWVSSAYRISTCMRSLIYSNLASLIVLMEMPVYKTYIEPHPFICKHLAWSHTDLLRLYITVCWHLWNHVHLLELCVYLLCGVTHTN